MSGFRERGLANGVSPFSSENEMEENVKNGRKRKQTETNGTRKKKKTSKKRKKWKRKKTEENGKNRSDTVPATPFAKS